ncbi:uncharacterized protein K452DRAFT_363126 [Aplosporella prunicola CBS 121167]|uniref:Heterokaryon incompatibility domain-containing protein n=1 Tax=Aplosporella prunicola CBS 121167 TaxID=1176127 RepID=A0A6A6AX55_9PEZI|nr:uncharacterized protein K452DRAFT_363126 [Aplosporella prunicola CBS 121167]KAF2135514.1 hypothetical protein K452DRAFT_363126 [Aplosporella prunicola CBS 121167]
MDHIPKPAHPVRERLKVPLLSLQNYDGYGDIMNYPESQDWTPRPYREWMRLFQNPPEHFQAFIQRWLYFGTLQTVLSCHVDVLRDFAVWVPGNEIPFLTTRRLMELLENARNFHGITQMAKGIDLIIFAVAKEFGNIKNHVYPPDPEQVLHLSHAIRQGQMSIALDSRISASMLILTELLPDALSYAYIDRTTQMSSREQYEGRMKLVQEIQGSKTGAALGDSFFWRILRETGWCPFEVSFMFARFNVCGLLFAYELARPGPSQTHNVIRIRSHQAGRRVCQPPDYQSLCTSYTCVHRVLEKNTYSTAHVKGCHGCHDVSADTGELCSILENETIPLILSIDENDISDKIHLVPWDGDSSYVAISHVWSDGLGNVRDNSLPHCQLKRLSTMVRNLVGKASNTVLLWLDTICVPQFQGAPSLEQKAAKRLAIKKMRRTYQDCKAALVLDSWLLSTSSGDIPNYEILMRVFSCAWNSRLWTYQEGALPPTVYFHFADKAHDLDALIKPFSSSLGMGMYCTLGGRLIRQYNNLRHFRKITESKANQLASVINAMNCRTTSVSTDEAICLGTLLELDLAKILDEKNPKNRMQAFWKQLKEIPGDVLQYSGPKLDTQGLGWAPQSLLLSRDHEAPETPDIPVILDSNWSSKSLTRTDNGLILESRATVINCGHCRLGRTFSVKDQDGFWSEYQIYYDHPLKTKGYYSEKNCYIVPHQFYGDGQVAVLFVDVYSSNNHERATSSADLGYLVVMKEESTEAKFVEKVGVAILRRLDDFRDQHDLSSLRKLCPFQYSFEAEQYVHDKYKGHLLFGFQDLEYRKWVIT